MPTKSTSARCATSGRRARSSPPSTRCSRKRTRELRQQRRVDREAGLPRGAAIALRERPRAHREAARGVVSPRARGRARSHASLGLLARRRPEIGAESAQKSLSGETMSLTPDEQQLAQDVLVSMQRLLERGGFLTRLELGAPESPKHPACGCALGADWFFYQRSHKAALERYGARIFRAYSARFGVDEWFVEGITVSFDADTGEPSTYVEGLHVASYPAAGDCTPREWAARDRGRAGTHRRVAPAQGRVRAVEPGPTGRGRAGGGPS